MSPFLSPSSDPPHSLLLHSLLIHLPPSPPPSLSSCSPTITQTEASVSAVFLAILKDPPHNQTGAMLILPSQTGQARQIQNTAFHMFGHTGSLGQFYYQLKGDQLSIYSMNSDRLGGQNPYILHYYTSFFQIFQM